MRSSAAAPAPSSPSLRRGGHAHVVQLDLGQPPGLIERGKRAPFDAPGLGRDREERDAVVCRGSPRGARPPPAGPRSDRRARSACGRRAGSRRPGGAPRPRSRRRSSSCRARTPPASRACGPPRSPGAARAAARRCRRPAARSRPDRRSRRTGAQSSASPIASSSAASSTAPRPSPPYASGTLTAGQFSSRRDRLPELGREAELAPHGAPHLLRGGVLRQEGARGGAQGLLLLGEGEAHAGLRSRRPSAGARPCAAARARRRRSRRAPSGRRDRSSAPRASRRQG